MSYFLNELDRFMTEEEGDDQIPEEITELPDEPYWNETSDYERIDASHNGFQDAPLRNTQMYVSTRTPLATLAQNYSYFPTGSNRSQAQVNVSNNQRTNMSYKDVRAVKQRNRSREVPTQRDLSAIPNYNGGNRFHQDQTIYVSQLPDKARRIFPFAKFNKMQSESFSEIFEADTNCVISSPTGSGKTVLFELAILRLYLNYQRGNELKNFKILYMAPTKALCSERYKDWSEKFVALNLTVGLLTSDTSIAETDSVRKSDIIICTAEKWDLLTRRWSDYSKLFELVKLLLVDEVHVVKNSRGSTLEVVITRMKRMCQNLRIVALSATVPNIEDVSKWIKNRQFSSVPAPCLVFGDEYRAVKLNRFVYGCKNTTNNDYQFDSFLNPKVLELIRTHFKGKPVLIFCATRASCVSTAKYLKSNCYGLFDNLQRGSFQQFKDRELSNMSQDGIAFHHAGLSYEDRQAVESGFLSGAIKVLCSTSTLSVGINLPAYLVILKGTKSWQDGGLKEYSDLDVLQMVGRAGRPQFESEGCAVVLTELSTKQKYERIIQGTEKLESCLHLHFPENLAAEVTLKTIDSVESAVDWLKSTFFFTRYIRNPTAYNEVKELRVGSLDLEERLAHFCQQKLLELLKEKIIVELDRRYISTPYCDSMSRHYVLFDTMKLFIHSPKTQTIRDVLYLFSDSCEFKDLRLKLQEKKLFKEIANSPLAKFPVGLKEPMVDKDKIFLLIQYELGGLEFPNYNGSLKLHSSFNNDKNYIFKQSSRIVECMIDVFVEKKDAGSLLSALKLARCLNGRCWENNAMELRQLQGVGLAYVRRLASHNVMSLSRARLLEPAQFEYYSGMRPGSGAKIKKDMDSIPKFWVKTSLLRDSLTEDLTTVSTTFSIEIGMDRDSTASRWHGKFLVADVVTESNGRDLLDFRIIPVFKLAIPKTFSLDIPLKSVSDTIKCHVSCSEIAGTEIVHQFELSAIPKWKFNKLLVPSFVDMPQFAEEVSPESSEFDEDDDFEIDKLLTKSNSEKKEMKEPYALRGDGRFECNHACKNKNNCRHLCCKEGLLKNPMQQPIGCNHSCKDKSRCRHLCCKDQPFQQQFNASRGNTEERTKSELHPHKILECQSPSPDLFKPSAKPVRDGPTPELPPAKKVVKLPPVKKNRFLDSDGESDEDFFEFDDALNSFIKKPKPIREQYNITSGENPDSRVSVDTTEDVETVPGSKGFSMSDAHTVTDDTSTYNKNQTREETCIDTDQKEEKKSAPDRDQNERSWFNDYSLILQTIPPAIAQDESDTAYDQKEDSVLNFLGSDIEIG